MSELPSCLLTFLCILPLHEHLGGFYPLTLVRDVAVNTHVPQICVDRCVCISLGFRPREWNGWFRQWHCLPFWRTSRLFSKAAAQFTFPPVLCEGSSMFTFFPALAVFLIEDRPCPCEGSAASLWFWTAFPSWLQASPVAQMVVGAEDLGQADPLEKGTATHSSILAWRIPWTEKPGGLQSLLSQRVRCGWSD